MSHQESVVHDDTSNLNNISMDQLGSTNAIRLLPIVSNVAFYVTAIMLQLFQLNGFFGGLAPEDPHEHIHNFLDLYGPFIFKNILLESIRMRLFPFSLVG